MLRRVLVEFFSLGYRRFWICRAPTPGDNHVRRRRLSDDVFSAVSLASARSDPPTRVLER